MYNSELVQLDDVHLELRKLQSLLFFMEHYCFMQDVYSRHVMYAFQDALDKLETLINNIDYLITNQEAVEEMSDDDYWEEVGMEEWNASGADAPLWDEHDEVEQSVQDRLRAQVGREVF